MLLIEYIGYSSFLIAALGLAKSITKLIHSIRCKSKSDVSQGNLDVDSKISKQLTNEEKLILAAQELSKKIIDEARSSATKIIEEAKKEVENFKASAELDIESQKIIKTEWAKQDIKQMILAVFVETAINELETETQSFKTLKETLGEESYSALMETLYADAKTIQAKAVERQELINKQSRLGNIISKLRKQDKNVP